MVYKYLTSIIIIFMVEKRKIRLFIDTIKIKCDSIFSPSEMTPDPSTFVLKSDPVMLARYLSFDKLFYRLGTNYKRQFLLKRLALEFQELLSWDFSKAYRLISHIAGIFHMNALEITFWSILLGKVTESFFRPRLLAYFTAFQAKLSLNYEMLPYENFLNAKIPNFKLLFNNWQLVLDTTVEISMKELNKKYTDMLNKKNSFRNYKLMIESLMEVPKRKKSILSEQLSETTQNEDMEIELQNFQKNLLNGEKLSPICEL